MEIKQPVSGMAVSSQLQAARTAKDPKQDAKLKEACKEMEAVFLNMLLEQMRRTVPKNSLTDGGNQEEIMRSMLDTEMTRGMAKAGGIGLADMMYRQLSLPTSTITKGQAPK